MESGSAEPGALRWLALWYFGYFAFLGAFGTYFSLYLTSLGVSPWGIGILLSLQPVMRVVAPNLWGWVADHYGIRARLVLFTSAASVLVMTLVPLTREFSTLLALIALQGLFWSASLPLVEALTLFHLSHRIEQYGRVRLWGSVGFIASVQGVGILLDRVPISALPWICWALALATCLLSLPLRDGGKIPHPVSAASFRLILRRPEVLALFGAAFMMSAAHAPLYVFYSVHLVNHGYPKTIVGLFWALGVIAEIGVFILMPRLMRRAEVRTILLWSHGIAVVRFILIGSMVEVPAVAVLAQLMHGATFGATHAACVAALNQWFPAGQQSRAQSLYSSLSFGAGGVVGGLVAGYLWQTWGAGGCFTVAAVFAATGGVLVWGGMGRLSCCEAQNRSTAGGRAD